jgi:hypothetical protein
MKGAALEASVSRASTDTPGAVGASYFANSQKVPAPLSRPDGPATVRHQ